VSGARLQGPCHWLTPSWLLVLVLNQAEIKQENGAACSRGPSSPRIIVRTALHAIHSATMRYTPPGRIATGGSTVLGAPPPQTMGTE